MEKTINSWINTLPKELKKHILYKKPQILKYNKNKVKCLSDAIVLGFEFCDQDEGFHFWNGFYATLVWAETDVIIKDSTIESWKDIEHLMST